MQSFANIVCKCVDGGKKNCYSVRVNEHRVRRERVFLKERIIQFGEGNFLRGFADYFVNELNERAGFDTSVVIIKPRPGGSCEVINEQSGEYTTILRGLKNGEVFEEIKKNTCISRAINPYTHYCQFIALARSADLKFVFSNTTEAGIVFDESCSPLDEPQASFPGKVTRFLLERYRFFDGAADAGLIFIPCELIDKNGDKLKECVIKYARLWGLGDGFVSWVEKSCTFTNTLVDRIVTGYPAQRAQEWEKRLGYKDRLMVEAEPFHLWVIEGMSGKKDLLPLDKYGFNVIFTDDCMPYKTRKVRILNGAHTMSVMAAHMCGYKTVLEMMSDGDFDAFIRKGLFEEIIPTIDSLPKEELAEYAESVLERFKNPYLHHRLLDICLNSVAKYRERVVPSLVSYYDMSGSLPPLLTFSLAALILFYRSGSARDDERVISFINENATEKILENEQFWGQNLNEINSLAGEVDRIMASCGKNGVKDTLRSIL